jgi:hypothetical protein
MGGALELTCFTNRTEERRRGEDKQGGVNGDDGTPKEGNRPSSLPRGEGGKEKWRGRASVPAPSRARRASGGARAPMAEPIYRPAMAVAIAKIFSPLAGYFCHLRTCSGPKAVHHSAILFMLVSKCEGACPWGSDRAGKVTPRGHGAVPIGEIFGRRGGEKRPCGSAVFAIIFTCSWRGGSGGKEATPSSTRYSRR